MCIVYCKCLTDIAWTDISRGPTHVARCHFGIPAVSGIWCVKRFPSGSSVRKDWLSVQVLERSGEALLLVQPRNQHCSELWICLYKNKQTKGPVSVSIYIFLPLIAILVFFKLILWIRVLAVSSVFSCDTGSTKRPKLRVLLDKIPIQREH